ncbi:hypothetical protein Tco_0924941 [Tanacetum coccineum]|uniref:Uncharacterized protein n=1 Tax=Tanacetum coccineum TaxID=301880 RepID=A0ABQ5D6T3_9ASTR
MKAIRQVLRYVQGTKDHGSHKHNGGNKIHGYSDSSYGVNTQEGKGTTGIIFYYGESPISWSTQKQATVALSSCESEFIAATAAATQALWLKRLLSKLTHSQEEKVIIQVDNKSAISLMKNPCKVAWHAGFSCEESEEMSHDANDAAFGVVCETEGWKRCPKCRLFIEKYDGCETVTCRCGFKFYYYYNVQPTVTEWDSCRSILLNCLPLTGNVKIVWFSLDDGEICSWNHTQVDDNPVGALQGTIHQTDDSL